MVCLKVASRRHSAERLQPAVLACQMSDLMQRYARRMHLVVVAFWERAKNSHGDGSDDQPASEGLTEDSVLDLPKRRLLDPDLAIKDFADHVTFLVFGNPGFVFVTIGTAESVERTFAHIHRVPVVFGKKLPWAEMAVVHAVEDLREISNGSFLGFGITLTTHMPFHAAISVATPIMNPMAESTLQPRPALLRQMRMAQMIPPIMPATPSPRAKTTRGALPLQMVHRIKFGWA